jgi:hypothetical protein
MAKKNKQPSQKSEKKTLLKDIEIKLAEAVKDFHRKISDKKLEKKIHKAGKILSKSLTMEQIKMVHKEKANTPKKVKKEVENEKELVS